MDIVTGDILTGDTVTGETVTEDILTGDTVTGIKRCESVDVPGISNRPSICRQSLVPRRRLISGLFVPATIWIMDPINHHWISQFGPMMLFAKRRTLADTRRSQ